jgi:hypothetical protein
MDHAVIVVVSPLNVAAFQKQLFVGKQIGEFRTRRTAIQAQVELGFLGSLRVRSDHNFLTSG